MRIYKRKRGKRQIWYIDYLVEDGRRIRKKIGTSKKKAEEVLRELKIEALKRELGFAPEPTNVEEKKRLTLEEFAQDYLKYSQTNKTSRYSQLERTILKKNVIPFLKGRDVGYLDEVKTSHIEDYKVERAEKISNASVNRELACVKAMYNTAIRLGYVIENPVKKVKMLKEPPGRVRYLTKEEIKRLLDNCVPHLKPIVITALNTGMRKGEIFGLKWQDIDFSNKRIIVQNSKNNEKRIIPMNEAVKKSLRDVYKEYSQNEKVFNIKDCKRSFKTALRKACIEDFRFHDLRHTFASHLAMSGANLRTIQTLMGHKDITMTIRYSHLCQPYLEGAVKNLYENNKEHLY